MKKHENTHKQAWRLRLGRSRHRPTKVFEFVKFNLATLKVASNHQYMTKIFRFLPKKSGITAGYSTFSMEASKTKCVDMENVHVFFNESSPSSWTKLFGWILKSTRTRTSRKFRAYSISHRNWYLSILERFWMWVRLTIHHPHGRDQYCLMINWSSRQRQKYLAGPTPYCVGRKWMIAKVQLKDGQVKWKNSRCPLLQRIDRNRWRTNWIRVAYFPRIYRLQILQEIQHNLQKRSI